MPSLRKPSVETVRQFLREQSSLNFSYPEVGATASTPPAGYDADRARVRLGSGKDVFDAARAALRRWQQFQLGWAEAWPTETPIRTGEVVAVIATSLGWWWLNAARIVHVVEESGPISRFGFAYGTLPGHVERGEERFLIEWDHSDDSVWYEILAYSRPNHWLARLGYPIVRLFQKRFREDSAASMRRAVCA